MESKKTASDSPVHNPKPLDSSESNQENPVQEESENKISDTIDVDLSLRLSNPSGSTNTDEKEGECMDTNDVDLSLRLSNPSGSTNTDEKEGEYMDKKAKKMKFSVQESDDSSDIGKDLSLGLSPNMMIGDKVSSSPAGPFNPSVSTDGRYMVTTSAPLSAYEQQRMQQYNQVISGRSMPQRRNSAFQAYERPVPRMTGNNQEFGSSQPPQVLTPQRPHFQRPANTDPLNSSVSGDGRSISQPSGSGVGLAMSSGSSRGRQGEASYTMRMTANSQGESHFGGLDSPQPSHFQGPAIYDFNAFELRYRTRQLQQQDCAVTLARQRRQRRQRFLQQQQQQPPSTSNSLMQQPQLPISAPMQNTPQVHPETTYPPRILQMTGNNQELGSPQPRQVNPQHPHFQGPTNNNPLNFSVSMDRSIPQAGGIRILPGGDGVGPGISTVGAAQGSSIGRQSQASHMMRMTGNSEGASHFGGLDSPQPPPHFQGPAIYDPSNAIEQYNRTQQLQQQDYAVTLDRQRQQRFLQQQQQPPSTSNSLMPQPQLPISLPRQVHSETTSPPHVRQMIGNNQELGSPLPLEVPPEQQQNVAIIRSWWRHRWQQLQHEAQQPSTSNSSPMQNTPQVNPETTPPPSEDRGKDV
ncbi:hypothetical protein BUALT_Bualt02G0010000 [Buddleja alternifolia]|uniref:Uncharacterized protein n=1 Tax=Buddleja alternifolia TaxID=168488 RepID=A0AAV6XYI8_9LAMI|nr:hypothetical protein BUALT_Bualt02G0010000 [Buddleja alternifolia]